MLLVKFARNKFVGPKFIGRDRIKNNITTADVIRGQGFTCEHVNDLGDHLLGGCRKCKCIDAGGQAGGHISLVFPRQNVHAHGRTGQKRFALGQRFAEFGLVPAVDINGRKIDQIVVNL